MALLKYINKFYDLYLEKTKDFHDDEPYNFDSVLSKQKNLAFTIACMFEKNTHTIFKLIFRYNISYSGILDSGGNNGFLIACRYNYNLNVIKYLKSLNLTYKRNYESDDALLIASKYNKNINILKYLINDLKFDINYETYNGLNCFLLACKHNNIEVIEYFINDLKMNIYKLDEYNHNCLDLACLGNDIEVIQFLANKLTVNLQHYLGNQ